MKIFLFSILILSASSFAKDLTIHVQGMVCPLCSQGLTKHFSAQEAVLKVDVDMDKKTVHLTLKDNQTLDQKTVIKIVEDSGVAFVKME